MRFIPILIALLIAGSQLEAQSAKARARAAREHQSALREEGCGGCRVWVTGKDSTVLRILDPEATSTPNDYKGYPALWCDKMFGFREVVYYSSRGRVYAQHKCSA
jgi:hypothetical protein